MRRWPQSAVRRILAETQTILGAEQEAWLNKQLKASPATWNILAQQVMVGRVDRVAGEAEGYSMDQWPGYEANRQRLIKYLHEEKIANPVILTGDIHVNFANNIELPQQDKSKKAIPVATELVGTSISSGGNGLLKPKDYDATLAENPFVKFYNTNAVTSAARSRVANGSPTFRFSSTLSNPARQFTPARAL